MSYRRNKGIFTCPECTSRMVSGYVRGNGEGDASCPDCGWKGSARDAMSGPYGCLKVMEERHV